MSEHSDESRKNEAQNIMTHLDSDDSRKDCELKAVINSLNKAYWFLDDDQVGVNPPALLVNTNGSHSVTLLPVTIHCTSPLNRVSKPFS